MNYYRAPVIWRDETAFLLGGGPSVKGLDLSLLRGRRTIAINNAFRLLPQADVIFYADTRWWGWNGHDIAPDYQGMIISTCSAGANFLDPRVRRMKRDYGYDPRHLPPDRVTPLSEDRQCLSGPDSGYMAINLAFHFGASRIVLLGFDMGFKGCEAHWHPDHPVPSQESNYTDLFAPRYPALVEALAAREVEVIRCTPSALGFIAEAPLAEAVNLAPRARAFDAYAYTG